VFPRAEKLTSQIEKNARDHAIQVVSGWASSIYVRKLLGHITRLKKDDEITASEAKRLYTIGKYLVREPRGDITQADIDIYWSWLLDEELVGKSPSVSKRYPMRLSENTSTFEASKFSNYASWWLRISTLEPRKTIQLPLRGNPYVKVISDVGKGFNARKDKKGRWRFEVVDKNKWEIPKPKNLKVAIDVGLNVLAATSDGRTYGAKLKPKFDKLYKRVQSVRANRQRQHLPKNSKRLDALEMRLSGMVKSFTGNIVNKLVKRFKGHTFVIEDLDLRGCRGQKRFAYRALASNLATKAPVEKVNPAYTSQTCPSCRHISRNNRRGTDFTCRQCGRRSHADIIGAINLLRRSEADVKQQLVMQYWDRRNPEQECPPEFVEKYAARRQRSNRRARSSNPRRHPKGDAMSFKQDRELANVCSRF